MNLRVKSLSGMFALTCGLLFLIAIWPACACVPLEYREVALAELPSTAREDAGKVAPGIRPSRAWEFGYELASHHRKVNGYLIRGRDPGSRWDRDVKVHARPASPDREPIELQPID
jgi:hypothetical protein